MELIVSRKILLTWKQELSRFLRQSTNATHVHIYTSKHPRLHACTPTP